MSGINSWLRQPAVHLAGILLLALVLRLVNLGERSLWYDEAFAVLFAEKGLSAMLIGTLTPVAGGAADIHPLLYYVTLDGWMAVFGQSPFAVRLWSALLGVATVWVVYRTARLLFDLPTSQLAAFLVAVAPFHIQYSQEARMYALMALLLAAATWTYVHGTQALDAKRRAWPFLVAFGVFSGLAMYTQQLSAFYLAVLGFSPLLARRWRRLVWVMAGAGIALVVYAPWLVNLPGQLQKVQSYYWLENPSLARLLLTVRVFFTAALDFTGAAALWALAASLVLAVLLAALGLMAARRPRLRADAPSLRFLLGLALGPPLLMWLVSQAQSVYLERALLPSLLPGCIVIAWVLVRGGLPRPLLGVISGLGLSLVGMTLFIHYTWAQFPNSPFPTALAAIRTAWQPGDVILHQNKLTALPGVYYAEDLAQRFIGDRPGSSDDTLALPTQEVLAVRADACAAAAVAGAERVWWVTFEIAEAQYAAAGRTEYREAVTWLDEHFTLEERLTFGDLQVVRYGSPRGPLDPTCAVAHGDPSEQVG